MDERLPLPKRAFRAKESIIVVKTIVGIYRSKFYVFLAVVGTFVIFLLFILLTIAIFWVESGVPPKYVSFYWSASPVVSDLDKFYNIPLFWIGSWDWVLYGNLHFLGEIFSFSLLLGIYLSLTFYYTRKIMGCRTGEGIGKKGIAGLLAAVGASGTSIMPIALSMVGCGMAAYVFSTVVILGVTITSGTVTNFSRIFILVALSFLSWGIFDTGRKIEKAQKEVICETGSK